MSHNWLSGCYLQVSSPYSILIRATHVSFALPPSLWVLTVTNHTLFSSTWGRDSPACWQVGNYQFWPYLTLQPCFKFGDHIRSEAQLLWGKQSQVAQGCVIIGLCPMESCAQASLRDGMVNGERTGLGVSSASESPSAPGSCPPLAKSPVLLENSNSSSTLGLLWGRSRQCLHWDLFRHTLTQVPEPLSPGMDPQGLSSWSWPFAWWTYGTIRLLLPAWTDLSSLGRGHWAV